MLQVVQGPAVSMEASSSPDVCNDVPCILSRAYLVLLQLRVEALIILQRVSSSHYLQAFS